MNKKHFKTAIYCLSTKFGKRIPLKVTHFITDKCNLRCSYCYINYNKEKEMNTEQIKNMLNEFAKLGTQIYGIAGGEPLVRDDIFEIIKHAKSLGLMVTLATNGILIPEHIDEMHNIDNLIISLDGPKEIHDKLRGKGTFDKVVEAINLLNNKGIKATVNAVITKYNFEYIDFLVEFAKKHDVNLMFQPVVEIKDNSKSDALDNKELLNVIEKIKKLKKLNKEIITSDSSLSDLYNFKNGKSKKFQRNCLSGKIFCIISPDGKVVPCLLELGNKNIDGLKLGWKKAFLSLPDKSKCDCTFFCYHDTNKLFSLNPGLVLKGSLNLMKNKWVYQ